MEIALAALRKVDFDWTAHIDQIWIDQTHESERFQAEARAELAEHLEDLAESSKSASPLGIPLLGPAGSGKTHLLGFVRRRALDRGIYFVLADMTDVSDFWDTVALGYLRSLQQQLGDGRRQIDHWLDRMIERFGKDILKAKDIPSQRPPALINRTEELITRVRAAHRAEMQEHVDVMRALVLFACDHTDINDLGYKWLQGLTIDEDELGVFGFRQREQTPSRIVRGLSWLLSLTGSTVLALDQLDAIVAEHDLARGSTGADTSTEQQQRSLAIIQGIAGGLLELRDVTRRTLSVVSSLETTWDILDRQALVSMADRFGSKMLLKPGTGPEVFTQLVVGRLRPAYEAFEFLPPYPAYPYSDGFFSKYQDGTPRELLKACENHRKACRRSGVVSEAGKAVVVEPSPPPPLSDWRRAISELMVSQARAANLDSLLADDSEAEQDHLIEAVCEALVIENPVPASVSAKVDKNFMGTGNYDPLHARIRLVLSEEKERELHHSLRFLEKQHYRAFQARLKASLTASGIERDLSFRGLTIVRVSPPPSGAATKKLLDELHSRGGLLVTPSHDQLKLLLTIQKFLGTADEPEHFEEWLTEERPVSKMECFAPLVKSLFGAFALGSGLAPQSSTPTIPERKSANDITPATKPLATTRSDGMLFIGRRLTSGEPAEDVGIPLERLPYHTCVFAGSGSGKTVFLKRVVEEAAMLGIPSIVLDGANDLSRLGIAWPQYPEGFTAEDGRKAQRYHSTSEVVVWTPGATTGNPMLLNPLPDFDVGGSGTEREETLSSAIDVAVSSIGDMLIKQGSAAAPKQTAILRGALRCLAQRGGTIRDLVGVLREPPEEATSPYEKGEKLARELAELLHAEIENDPLVGGSGTPLDPSLLLCAEQPGKTRVSVLNLVGLPGYDRKRRFVDQLASTLFSWIKKHPAPSDGLLGLLVIDEAKDFVPSGKSVPGKENVIRLAAQARKYGLGLLFATQEPKSIDHAIVSNCSTLLAGKMASPAAIDALQQLLSDKGTHATDVGALKRGVFYFGSAPDKPRKIATSICLSYHPSTPPSEAEVLELARRSASRTPAT